MSNGELDRLPVSQLPARYELARSAVYTRMGALGIQPQKVGNRSFVNAQQVGLLDELHRFINSGGTTAEFIDRMGIAQSGKNPGQSPNLSSGLSVTPPDIVGLVRAIMAEMSSRFQPPSPEPDPLAYYRALEEVAQKGWQLKTSEVAYLLDLPPKEIERFDYQFYEAGFVFTRAGYRSGGEVAWRVSKR
ncbi:hypothetical protein IQ241_07140 [Romeria aff. gracilis LEGE 07310]|uniref:Uncharacterized protein n=1 Tax=Vasconcelosia minhoensis LEGE 07310 TaxID=915328 RepID=A0A8J7A5U7_9CYAN|nr:hypothetical protein [Romeria gracilis]MBE9077072.1 hypothetical protein [Romeria aff. gracilis LEGE 07310]